MGVIIMADDELIGPYHVKKTTDIVEWTSEGEAHPAVRPLRLYPGTYQVRIDRPLIKGEYVELLLEPDNVIIVRTAPSAAPGG